MQVTKLDIILTKIQILFYSWTIEWQGDGSAPKAINNLLLVETSMLSNIALSCMTKNAPVCSLPKANISVYQLKRNDYMIVCNGGKDVIPGEVRLFTVFCF